MSQTLHSGTVLNPMRQISLISIKGCVGDALTLTLSDGMYITLALNTIQIGGTKILS